MYHNDLTIVFFIENHYQENLLLLNPVINSLPVLAVYSRIKQKNFRGNILETTAGNFAESLPEIFKNIRTGWLLHLEPAEKIANLGKLPQTNQPFYFLKIRYFMNKKTANDDLMFPRKIGHKR